MPIGGPGGFWHDPPERLPVLVAAERRGVKLPGRIEFEEWFARDHDPHSVIEINRGKRKLYRLVQEPLDWNELKQRQIEKNREGRPGLKRTPYEVQSSAEALRAQHRKLLARAVARLETRRDYSPLVRVARSWPTWPESVERLI